MKPERTLAQVLSLVAVFELLAIPTILLPFSWMDYVHQFLGLGKLPEAPIVIYLARSVSILYGFHGVVTLCLSRDVIRYMPLIGIFAVCAIVMGCTLLVIDLVLGLPLWWAISEGAFAIVFGAVVWWLRGQVRVLSTEYLHLRPEPPFVGGADSK